MNCIKHLDRQMEKAVSAVFYCNFLSINIVQEQKKYFWLCLLPRCLNLNHVLNAHNDTWKTIFSLTILSFANTIPPANRRTSLASHIDHTGI